MRDAVVMKKEVKIKEDDFVFMCCVKPGDQVKILVNGVEVAQSLVAREQVVGKLAADCDFWNKLKEVNQASLNKR